jgi:hypothetical protein
MFFYHTPTSFPVQLQADKMHEYLAVKAFSPNILLLQMWPNEVITMKDASASASDNKPQSKHHNKIPDSLLNTSITKATTEHNLEPTAPTYQPQKLSP